MRRARWFGRAASGVVVAAVVLTAAALASPGADERVAKEGGTFRIAVPAGRFGTIDPALISGAPQLLEPACGNLMDTRASRFPKAAALRPELAEADPDVSRDGRTYTFRVRKDARFSDGSRVTARAFARAIERNLDPAMKSVFASGHGGHRGWRGRAVGPRRRRPEGVSAKGER